MVISFRTRTRAPPAAATQQRLGATSIAAAASQVAAHGTTQSGINVQEKITPLFKHRVLDAQDKLPLVAEVLFPPGAPSPPYTNPSSAFIFAYVQLVFSDPN
jgi:hypothetical protein